MKVAVCSRDRVSGTSSNFKVDLSGAAQRILNTTRCRILKVLMKYVIYNIRTGVNDKICFTRSSTNYTATLPAAGYNIQDFCTAIATAMNAQDSNTYAATYGTSTGLITITGSASFSMNMGLSSTSCYREMGFGTGITGAATTQTGTGVYDLSGPDTIYMDIAQFPQRQVSSNPVDYYTAAIPVDVNFGEVIDFSPCEYGMDYSWVFEEGKKITQLDISLFLQNREPANLNVVDWTMYLEFY